MTMDKSLIIYHINLRKSTNACLLLQKNLESIDDAIISTNEPKTKVPKIDTINYPLFCKDNNRSTRAAVYIKGDKIKGTLIAQASSPDVAVIDVKSCDGDFILISAYLPPDEPKSVNSEHKRALNELYYALSTIQSDKRIIICSDTNSRSSVWNDKLTNARGKELEEFYISNDLDLLNTNGKHTFENSTGGVSTIDLILCNSLFYEYKPIVEVLDDYTSSDHKMLRIEIEIDSQNNTLHKNSTRKYRTDKADWKLFDENLIKFNHIVEETNFNITNRLDADKAAEALNNYLEAICETAIPMLKHNGNRKPNENDEIKSLAYLEINLYRKYIRQKKTNRFSAHITLKELNEAKRLKLKEIEKHRKKCWEDRCSTENIRDVQKIHKMCKASLSRSCPSTIKDINGQPTKDSNETMIKLFEHAFPDKNHPKARNQLPIFRNEFNNSITVEEINYLISNLNNNKAPGVDGFTPEIIKKALPNMILPLATFFNALIKIQYFPTCWKMGFVIFIPKPNIPDKSRTVKDFRPITLLNVLAKVFEKLVISRLNKYLYSNKLMDTRQLGFCRQKSTVHALHSFKNFILEKKQEEKVVSAVMLDISGAFDNACWSIIIDSLIKLNCPNYLVNLIISYFEDRIITTNNKFTKIEKTTTQGCPQGSCSGPSL